MRKSTLPMHATSLNESRRTVQNPNGPEKIAPVEAEINKTAEEIEERRLNPWNLEGETKMDDDNA